MCVAGYGRQVVPLLRWMPAVWTSYVLYLAHLPLELLSKVMQPQDSRTLTGQTGRQAGLLVMDE